MRFINLLFLSLLLFFLMGCSSSKNLPVKTLFPFQYEGESYEIISITTSAGEGTNLLTKKDGGTTIFRTRDYNQDGRLDIIHSGNVTLDEVNPIYEFGILKAIELGKFKPRFTIRIFEYTTEDRFYSVQTFGLFKDELYNQFVVRDLFNSFEQKFLDLDADGILDRIEVANIKLEEARKLYKNALQLGIEAKQIEYFDGKYVVQITPDPPAS